MRVASIPPARRKFSRTFHILHQAAYEIEQRDRFSLLETIMRRRAGPRQGGNLSDLGRPAPVDLEARLSRRSRSRFTSVKNQRYRAKSCFKRYYKTIKRPLGLVITSPTP